MYLASPHSRRPAKITRLSKRRLEALIDREATRRLGMSGKEFVAQQAKLDPCTPAVGDIRMLVRLLSTHT